MTAARHVLTRQLALVLAMTCCAGLLSSAPAHAVDQRSARNIRDRIEYQVNRERIHDGRRKLRVNDKLQRWAKDHARDMARKGAIYHDSNLKAEGPSGCEAWGENVARTTASDAAKSTMNMFMGSAGHRDNVLRKRWTHMGIGVAKADGYTYVVQRFADRR